MIFSLLLAFVMPPELDRQLRPCREVVRVATAGNPAAEHCRLFIPAGYEASRRYPLVIFLHGGGGRGTDGRRHLEEGNGMLIHLLIAQTRWPAFVVAPQTATSHDPDAVLALADAIQAGFSIDRQRIYVMGQSLGGYGAFALLSRRPSQFAAAIIIAAGADATDVRDLRGIPMWLFHGERDAVIPVSEPRRIVAALRRAGARPRYTEYAGEGHGLAWLVVREKELVPWLFAQRR